MLLWALHQADARNRFEEHFIRHTGLLFFPLSLNSLGERVQQFTTHFLQKKKKKNTFEWKIRVRWQSLDHAVPFLIDYKPQNALIAPGHLARVKGMSTNKHKINAA